MEDQKKAQNQRIEIELKEDEAVGSYSNLAMISHSPSEFVIDFVSVLPGMKKGKVIKRILMTPDHAKRLAAAIQDNVRRYEEEFGPVKLNEKVEIPVNFRGQMGEA